VSALTKALADLTVDDIKSYRAARQNTQESNHPFGGNKDFMDLLVEGSDMLVEEFGGTNDYKIKLSGSE